VAEFLKQIPLVVWFGCAAIGVAAIRYAMLLVQRSRRAAASREALRRLGQVVEALRAYAVAHDGALPKSIGGVAPDWERQFVYRPVPGTTFDGRLIVVYDRGAPHALVAFPMLRAGRAAVTLGGKTLVLSEEQLEKLLAADNGLRVACGLEPVDLVDSQAAMGANDSRTTGAVETRAGKQAMSDDE